jgi:hypothetical protein
MMRVTYTEQLLKSLSRQEYEFKNQNKEKIKGEE